MESELPCKCQAWTTCTWSKQLVNQISILPKHHEIRQTLSRQFSLQICDQEKHHVFCCRGSEPASQSEMEQMRIMEPTELTTDLGNAREGKIWEYIR